MFIVETPHNPECNFFIQEEEPGELRTALLFSAVGNLAVEEARITFPQINCLLENKAVTNPFHQDEYEVRNSTILDLLATSSYRDNLKAIEESIDNAAATAKIDPHQWYEQRKAAEHARNIRITWITENGDASDKASLHDERIEISPMFWDSDLHTIGNVAAGTLYPTMQEVEKVIGAEELCTVLQKYKIKEHPNGSHTIDELGFVMGRQDESGAFKPLMTVLNGKPHLTGFTSSLRSYEMFTREGDTIVPITR